MSCTAATSSDGGNTKRMFQAFGPTTDAAIHTLWRSPHTKRTLNPVWHLISGITMGTGTRAGKSELPPQTLFEVLLPFTSRGPLLAPHCPNCPSSTDGLTPIRASDMGLYWLLWDCPSQVSLFILAALPPSQEDNLSWLPFISHVPARHLFSSHSFCLYLCPCFVDFHFTPLCCRMTRPPPQHPRVFFLFVILSAALSAVWEKRSWIDLSLIYATVSLCVLLYRHSSASCLFTLAFQLGPHSQYGRGHEMRSVTDSAYWRYCWISNPPSLTFAVFQSVIICHLNVVIFLFYKKQKNR